MTDKINYKSPLHIWVWMKAALEMECKKFNATPVTADLIPDYMLAQALGYVVTGYSLIEQGLKAALIVHGCDPPKTHALSALFTKLPTNDKDVLREYYNDFRHTFPNKSTFPLETLDMFLENLDGVQNSKG